MVTWRWKSSGELVVATQVNRKAPTARGALKEAANESASRGTRTGYEARPSRASGQQTAKLSRPRLRRCKSGGCAGKATVLTWGDLALRLKGRRGRPGARSQPRPQYRGAPREGPNSEESASTVHRGKATHQTSRQLELPLGDWGESLGIEWSGEAGRAGHGNERSGSHRLLMEQVVARENAMAAFKRVRRNRGSPGIDGMTVRELGPYLRAHWSAIRTAGCALRTARGAPARCTTLNLLNRRMRTRMSGGVGGE